MYDRDERNKSAIITRLTVKVEQCKKTHSDEWLERSDLSRCVTRFLSEYIEWDAGGWIYLTCFSLFFSLFLYIYWSVMASKCYRLQWCLCGLIEPGPRDAARTFKWILTVTYVDKCVNKSTVKSFSLNRFDKLKMTRSEIVNGVHYLLGQKITIKWQLWPRMMQALR